MVKDVGTLVQSPAGSVDHLEDHLHTPCHVQGKWLCTGRGPPACRSDGRAQGGGIVRLLEHFARSVPKEYGVGEVKNTIARLTILQLKEMLTVV